MKKKNTLRRNSLKLKKYKRRNSLKLKKSKRRNSLKRRNYLKRRNSLKLKKSKRRNSLKRRKMRGGFRTKDFWGESKNDDVFQILSRVGNNFSRNPNMPKAEDISSTGKTLKFSRFMYGNPEDKIKEAEQNKIKASVILERAEKVISDYQEEIDRGYYLETCVVREDDGDRAEGVLYLFIIDIPSTNIRYVMSFGFGDLAWGRSRITASYPPDGKVGTWLSSSEWGTINGEKSAEKRMNMLKGSFMRKFQFPDSIVHFVDTITSNEEWKKRIGVYTIDISTEQSSVVSTPSTVQSSQQLQQVQVNLDSTLAQRPQQLDRVQGISTPALAQIIPPERALFLQNYLDNSKFTQQEKVYIRSTITLLHSRDEDVTGNYIMAPLLSITRGFQTPKRKQWILSSSEIRYIWGIILFNWGLINYLETSTEYIQDSSPQTSEKIQEIYQSSDIGPTDLIAKYYHTKPPLTPIIHNFTIEDQVERQKGDALLINYMKSTASMYKQQSLRVENYAQNIEGSFLSIMESFKDDYDYPLRYSYVNIKNENKGLLYIFILLPVAPSSEGVSTRYYGHVFFHLICILKQEELKQFIFPINTRLLFWCSDLADPMAALREELTVLNPRALQKRAEAEGVSEEDLDSVEDSAGIVELILQKVAEKEELYRGSPAGLSYHERENPELGGETNIRKYYGTRQQPKTHSPITSGKNYRVRADPGPEESIVETAKEAFKGYETSSEPMGIPAINNDKAYTFSDKGLNHPDWSSEIFKYCKIDSINAIVTVQR